jgi:uncharacterized protein with HEPN domain
VYDYLRDILNAVDEVESFVKGMDFEEFVKDRKTLNAVVRSIEIIGEASKHIPASLREKYAELPWKEITGMRDKLIHGYFGMDYETIWKAAKEDVPSLKKVVRRMLKEQEKR